MSSYEEKSIYLFYYTHYICLNLRYFSCIPSTFIYFILIAFAR